MEAPTKLSRLWADLREALSLPRLRIRLMADAARDNDPFFLQCVESYYRDSVRRHPKLPLIRNREYGIAVCVLPADHESYLRKIESSARRNIKKAQRLGYEFRRIDANEWLGDLAAILRSTDTRQGKMPDHLLAGGFAPVTDPPSRTKVHDYAYFGIIKDGHCWAYATCLVAGELINIGDIYGHDAAKADGLVPLLISEIARYALENHPTVRYFVYDKYFGASETLRRFKTKFDFLPHRVSWSL
jgi:hypothetical protein